MRDLTPEQLELFQERARRLTARVYQVLWCLEGAVVLVLAYVHLVPVR